MAEPEILRGWKEIERFLGMKRDAIQRAQYPIRCEYGEGSKRRNVFAIRQELLDHARGKSLLFTPRTSEVR